MTRECGACSLCCKLPPITELEKPIGKWCRHAMPGKGCLIYNERPEVCQRFKCEWLRSDLVDDAWYPPKAKMILYVNLTDEGLSMINVAVDTGWPKRWRAKGYHTKLKRIALAGLDPTLTHVVRVYDNGREWVILPDKDVEITGWKQFKVYRTGLLGWDVREQ